MALQDNALTTVSAVESELDLASGTDTAYLERQINRYSDLLEEATGRTWHRDDSHTETVKSVGDTRLTVDRRPVRSISEIKVKGDTVDSGDYEIEDADTGWIRLDDDFWESTAVATRRVEQYVKYHELRVEVTMDAGYVTPKQVDDGTFSTRDLPHYIEGAIIDTVSNKYLNRAQRTDVESESIGSASVTYRDPSMDGEVMGQAVSGSFESAVSRHKDRSVL